MKKRPSMAYLFDFATSFDIKQFLLVDGGSFLAMAEGGAEIRFHFLDFKHRIAITVIFSGIDRAAQTAEEKKEEQSEGGSGQTEPI